MHPPCIKSKARIWLVSWTLVGIGIGCNPGKSDQPELAPTPEGVELLKPDPKPPKKDPNGS